MDIYFHFKHNYFQTSGKQQTITLEDRIAKNVADEILRNYKVNKHAI